MCVCVCVCVSVCLCVLFGGQRAGLRRVAVEAAGSAGDPSSSEGLVELLHATAPTPATDWARCGTSAASSALAAPAARGSAPAGRLSAVSGAGARRCSSASVWPVSGPAAPDARRSWAPDACGSARPRSGSPRLRARWAGVRERRSVAPLWPSAGSGSSLSGCPESS